MFQTNGMFRTVFFQPYNDKNNVRLKNSVKGKRSFARGALRPDVFATVRRVENRKSRLKRARVAAASRLF